MSSCWRKILRTTFWLRRRPELYLSILQQPKALHGIAASPASYCHYNLTGTYSAWSLRLFANAATPSHPHQQTEKVIKSKKWRHTGILTTLLFNIYTSDCQSQSPKIKKYAYADDLAIMHTDGDWQAVEGVLSKIRRLWVYSSRCES